MTIVNEVEPDKMAFYFHDGFQPGDEAACQTILNAHHPSVVTPIVGAGWNVAVQGGKRLGSGSTPRHVKR